LPFIFIECKVGAIAQQTSPGVSFTGAKFGKSACISGVIQAKDFNESGERVGITIYFQYREERSILDLTTS